MNSADFIYREEILFKLFAVHSFLAKAKQIFFIVEKPYLCYKKMVVMPSEVLINLLRIMKESYGECQIEPLLQKFSPLAGHQPDDDPPLQPVQSAPVDSGKSDL
jgi:hypothetical protein